VGFRCFWAYFIGITLLRGNAYSSLIVSMTIFLPPSSHIHSHAGAVGAMEKSFSNGDEQ